LRTRKEGGRREERRERRERSRYREGRETIDVNTFKWFHSYPYKNLKDYDGEAQRRENESFHSHLPSFFRLFLQRREKKPSARQSVSCDMEYYFQIRLFLFSSQHFA